MRRLAAAPFSRERSRVWGRCDRFVNPHPREELEAIALDTCRSTSVLQVHVGFSAPARDPSPCRPLSRGEAHARAAAGSFLLPPALDFHGHRRQMPALSRSRNRIRAIQGGEDETGQRAASRRSARVVGEVGGPGAGRKPKGERAGVPHRPRAPLASRFPVHVTAPRRPRANRRRRCSRASRRSPSASGSRGRRRCRPAAGSRCSPRRPGCGSPRAPGRELPAGQPNRARSTCGPQSKSKQYGWPTCASRSRRARELRVERSVGAGSPRGTGPARTPACVTRVAKTFQVGGHASVSCSRHAVIDGGRMSLEINEQ